MINRHFSTGGHRKRLLSSVASNTSPVTPIKTTVLKFGGSSVGSAKTIRKVGDIILAAQKNHGSSRLVLFSFSLLVSLLFFLY